MSRASDKMPSRLQTHLRGEVLARLRCRELVVYMYLDPVHSRRSSNSATVSITGSPYNVSNIVDLGGGDVPGPNVLRVGCK